MNIVINNDSNILWIFGYEYYSWIYKCYFYQLNVSLKINFYGNVWVITIMNNE